jgi:energy-converting hydrogenase Eha subunit E
MSMQTKTTTATSTLQANLMELPIMKHFEGNQVTAKVESFRKGEFTMYTVLKLALLGVIGYAAWVYVLPPVFQMLGQLIAVAATGVALVFLVLMMPVIFKALRAFTRFLHKNLIKHDPFAELENQKQRMIQNQQTFRISKSKISNLKDDMQVEAKKSQDEAETLQNKIITLQGKAASLKSKLDEMVKTGGADARNSDEFVNGNADLIKILSESQRVSNKLVQSKDFIQKYGTRAAVMKKMGQKLTMVEASMDIKIADFDATVEMLKKDYEFGQKSNAATTAAKNAMLFDKSWELDYALDVVTSTIASDIAITSGNLRDIDSLTANYAMDSDELYTNLDVLADKIKTGGDVIPSAKQYNNPEYRLTESDKLSSGGFGDMF